ncbi:MAG TPA: hypothetical protein VJO34_14325 [Methylomirabilota bacterium]|nr:hypothetical protein [Methylomirabilota bacterium]
MALSDAALTAARSLDALLDRLRQIAEIKPAPGKSGSDHDLDQRLADAIRRGQIPQMLDALRRALR